MTTDDPTAGAPRDKADGQPVTTDVEPDVAAREHDVPSDLHLTDQDTRALGRHTLIAAAIALVVFLAFVLPAEYGLDPTGIGAVTGVSQIYSEDPDIDTATADPAPIAQRGFRQDTTTIGIAPGQGLEFKFIMTEGDALVYEWYADSPTLLFFDLHGEPDEGPAGYFESYRVARRDAESGALVAPFTGTHGWFWENESDNLVTITLESSGFYDVKGVTEA